MKALVIVLVIVVILLLIGLAMALRIVKQYEQGVLFRFGRLRGSRSPGLRLIIPFVDVLHRVSLRIVTMPIQSQGIITRHNVSVDVSGGRGGPRCMTCPVEPDPASKPARSTA
jgi:regulator of protease activity HflC (stomatin/prohibitin superfamily)